MSGLYFYHDSVVSAFAHARYLAIDRQLFGILRIYGTKLGTGLCMSDRGADICGDQWLDWVIGTYPNKKGKPRRQNSCRMCRPVLENYLRSLIHHLKLG